MLLSMIRSRLSPSFHFRHHSGMALLFLIDLTEQRYRASLSFLVLRVAVDSGQSTVFRLAYSAAENRFICNTKTDTHGSIIIIPVAGRARCRNPVVRLSVPFSES